MVPRVSVVMPAFNAEKYVASAVSSILQQTFCDFELLIMDDGSSDRTWEILSDFKDSRIRLMRQPNAGLSRSLNRLISQANTNLIARMDADDMAHPNRLEEQVAFMQAHPECVVLGTNANFIAEDGAYLYTSECLTDWSDIRTVLPASPHFHSSTVFRLQAFNRCGGYFEKVPQFFEDQILWNGMSKFGELRNLSNVLLDYRITPTSISADKSVQPLLKSLAHEIIQTGGLSQEQYLSISKLKMRQQQTKGDRWGWYWGRIGKIHLEHNFNRKTAIQCLVRSLQRNPYDASIWFNVGLALLPRAVVREWKKRRGVYQRVW